MPIEIIKDLGVGGLVGFLVGLGVVSWVEPTTTGGTGLLLIVSISMGTILGWIVPKVFRRRTAARGKDPTNDEVSTTEKDEDKSKS